MLGITSSWLCDARKGAPFTYSCEACAVWLQPRVAVHTGENQVMTAGDSDLSAVTKCLTSHLLYSAGSREIRNGRWESFQRPISRESPQRGTGAARSFRVERREVCPCNRSNQDFCLLLLNREVPPKFEDSPQDVPSIRNPFKSTF